MRSVPHWASLLFNDFILGWINRQSFSEVGVFRVFHGSAAKSMSWLDVLEVLWAVMPSMMHERWMLIPVICLVHGSYLLSIRIMQRSLIQFQSMTSVHQATRVDILNIPLYYILRRSWHPRWRPSIIIGIRKLEVIDGVHLRLYLGATQKLLLQLWDAVRQRWVFERVFSDSDLGLGTLTTILHVNLLCNI